MVHNFRQKWHRPPPEVGQNIPIIEQNIPIEMTKNYHRIRRLSLPKVYSFFNDLGGGCPCKCPYKRPWFTSKTNGILRFLCNVGTCADIKRNKIGGGITPKRHKIGCLRLPTSAANVQIMHKKWAKLVQVLHIITPSNSTSLTASISTRWSKVVSRPYFNKKKEASQPLSRAYACVYTIYNTLTFSVRFEWSTSVFPRVCPSHIRFR